MVGCSCATKVQPERVVTVLVVGAAGAGKSTLLKMLGFAGVFCNCSARRVDRGS